MYFSISILKGNMEMMLIMDKTVILYKY